MKPFHLLLLSGCAVFGLLLNEAAGGSNQDVKSDEIRTNTCVTPICLEKHQCSPAAATDCSTLRMWCSHTLTQNNFSQPEYSNSSFSSHLCLLHRLHLGANVHVYVVNKLYIMNMSHKTILILYVLILKIDMFVNDIDKKTMNILICKHRICILFRYTCE